ncbi:MAG TPA: DUF3052 domain-containing protein [Galbitalea sp.]
MASSQLHKLGLVPGARWTVVGADSGWSFETEPDVATRVSAGQPADVVLAFAREAAEITTLLERFEGAVFPSGALWIAWPRRAGGHTSDITDNVVRDAALVRRLVDVKVAAIDSEWSGLKLVWRKEFR